MSLIPQILLLSQILLSIFIVPPLRKQAHDKNTSKHLDRCCVGKSYNHNGLSSSSEMENPISFYAKHLQPTREGGRAFPGSHSVPFAVQPGFSDTHNVMDDIMFGTA